MKSLISCFLAVSLLTLLCAQPVSADGIAGEAENPANIEEMKGHLVQRDYPMDYLDTLMDQQVAALYERAERENLYFYCLEQRGDDPGGVMPNGVIPASDLDFDVMLSLVLTTKEGEPYITAVDVSIYYDWLEPPFVRNVDPIAVNWDADKFVYKADSFVANDYALPFLGSWFTYKTWYAPANLVHGGLGYYAYIDYTDSVMGTPTVAAGLRGDANFMLLPKSGWSMLRAPGGDITTIRSQYGHNKNIAGSLGFEVDGVNISVSASALSDEIAAAGTINYTEA